MTDHGNPLAASSPPNEAELTMHLWEACVEADWASVDALCEKYTKTKHGVPSSMNGSDSTVSAIIKNFGEENSLVHNPLMAAVLHVAIDVAAAHRSFSLFSDSAAPDLVAAEEHKRRLCRSSASYIAPPLNDPITVDDFCPYLKMRQYGDADREAIDDEHRRARRKAIAKLCRANPLWILLPMIPRGSRGGKTSDESDATFDEDLPRGTTPLHVAIRSRNVMLTLLLIKYCPKAAEIADVDGCIPLHYAVRPADEMTVLRRAVLTYQRSLSGGADNAPLETGPNEVHSGVNLYYHGKVLFKASRESTDLARCRVRRMRRNHRLREQKSRMLGSSLAHRRLASKEMNFDSKDGKSENYLANKNDEDGNSDTNTYGKNDCTNTEGEVLKTTPTPNNKDEGRQRVFPNMYVSPSSLVRAMMHLGTVEEDSADLVQSEWIIHQDDDKGGDGSNDVLATVYPIVVDCMRTISRGLGRPTRPWKMERHRTTVVRLLSSIHPQGMLYQCDDGGDNPLILACQTLQGDDGEEDEFGDFAENDLEEEELDEMPEDNMNNEPVPDEIGEDSADYEMDLSSQPSVVEANAETVNREQQSSNESVADQDDGGGENDEQDQPAGPNNANEAPLEAVMYMIAKNGSTAMGIPDDDGDTALHVACRIGASPRLVQRLLNTMPALASTPAEDGSTPLHLACRRACHLAPEGNGGMGTYDGALIRMLADAAGSGTLSAADDVGRTPFHVACRSRASPAVLAELADSDGGRDALLVRDAQGHAPLGVYCVHATDYHGLRVLVHRCPDAAAAMGDGRQLPLHRILATFNLAVNVDCLRLIGNAYPQGLDSMDSRGMTPLALLCESYQGPLKVDIPKLQSGRTTLERCLSKKIWLMARYLILVARTNRRWKSRAKANGSSLSELVLHATLREPSSSIEIVQLATVVHADQLKATDANGELPLHLCCRRKQSGCSINSSSEENETSIGGALHDEDSVTFKRVNEGVIINEVPVNLDSSPPTGDTTSSQRQHKYNPCRDHLLILYHILLSDMSAAGHCNNEGKFPLNVLIDRDSTWRGGGVDRVLKAFPQALFSYELSNSLFALAIGRTSGYQTCSNPDILREEQTSCIGATFQLLRGKPTALEGANFITDPNESIEARRKSKRARKK